MLDPPSTVVNVEKGMGLKIKTESSNGAAVVAMAASTPMSPSRARASFGRAMPFFIGVAGGTASGKTTVCDCIMQRLHDQCVVMLSQDSFYRGLTEEEHHNAHCKCLISPPVVHSNTACSSRSSGRHKLDAECPHARMSSMSASLKFPDMSFVPAAYNFDHPSAFDSKAIVKCLRNLQSMQQVDIPVYDFITHQRSTETRRVEPADVVIIEGIMVLHMKEVREMLNMKIYVDTDDDVRLARR